VVLSPKRLIVDFHHADSDLIVPVRLFLRHFREEQPQSTLVNARVLRDPLEDKQRHEVSPKICKLDMNCTVCVYFD